MTCDSIIFSATTTDKIYLMFLSMKYVLFLQAESSEDPGKLFCEKLDKYRQAFRAAMGVVSFDRNDSRHVLFSGWLFFSMSTKKNLWPTDLIK
jgi:hypothetical protein